MGSFLIECMEVRYSLLYYVLLVLSNYTDISHEIVLNKHKAMYILRICIENIYLFNTSAEQCSCKPDPFFRLTLIN